MSRNSSNTHHRTLSLVNHTADHEWLVPQLMVDGATLVSYPLYSGSLLLCVCMVEVTYLPVDAIFVILREDGILFVIFLHHKSMSFDMAD